MLDFLAGVPGKLKTIYTHLTSHLSSTRCLKIDKLDDTITSRAPSNTALSTSVWTSGRAQNLDKLTRLPDSDPPTSCVHTACLGNAVNTSSISYSSGYLDTLRAAVVGDRYNQNASTSLVTVLSVSGSGVLNFVAHATGINVGTNALICQVEVDGVVVAKRESDINKTNYACCLVGTLSKTGANDGEFAAGLDQIPFKESLVVKACSGSASVVSSVIIKYRRNS